jgi:hypothetical protein
MFFGRESELMHFESLYAFSRAELFICNVTCVLFAKSGFTLAV